MTPTYRKLPERLALAVNNNADAIASTAIALIVLACLATALVCHPALYLR
jgi:hypothetical protein